MARSRHKVRGLWASSCLVHSAADHPFGLRPVTVRRAETVDDDGQLLSKSAGLSKLWTTELATCPA